MKYSVNVYAKALAEAAAKPSADVGKITKNFLALLRANGDEQRLGAILRAAERLLWKMTDARKVTVASARKLPKPAKTLFEELLKKNDIVEEVIDPALVAGVTVTVNEELQFDGSLKGRLDKMFA